MNFIKPSTQTQWADHADIVVVGGGGAGLTAAVVSAKLGNKIILLEKAQRIGGTTSLAVGSIAAAGTPFQESAGIEDSPDLHLDDMKSIMRGRPGRDNQDLRQILVEEASKSVMWLSDHGVQFIGPNPASGYSRPRLLNAVPNAKAYIALLNGEAKRLGVDIRIGTRASQLIQARDGRVIGVTTLSNEGKNTSTIGVDKAVILCTGYFHADKEMRIKHISGDAAEVEPIEPNQTGDGHRMAIEIGAQMVNMGTDSYPEFRFVTPPGQLFLDRIPLHPWFLSTVRLAISWIPKSLILFFIKSLLTAHTAPSPELFHEGAILINREGRRFANELNDFLYSVSRQPGKSAYILFDHYVGAKFSSWPNPISTAPGIAYAYLQDYRRLRPDICKRAETLDDLAKKVGLPSHTLIKTIQTYNQFVDKGEDRAFGRQQLGLGIRNPPYYILGPAKSYFVDSQGGPKINSRCQILNLDGEPIPGLYAAGAFAKGELIYSGPGVDLAWVFTSGRLAAKYASEST